LGALLIATALAGSGCEKVTRVDRPLPEVTFRTPDGDAIDRAALIGRPWIINLWVPG
jgi:hypothetical protein